MADSQRKTANLLSSSWEQGIINATTGNPQVSNNIIRTADYIRVEYNTIYSMNRDKYSNYMNIRLYDANKGYIGAGTDATIKIISGGNTTNPMRTGQSFCCFKLLSSNVAYIKINDATNDLTTKYMMVKGEYTAETMPAYEPYGWVHSLRKLGTDTVWQDATVKEWDGSEWQ